VIAGSSKPKVEAVSLIDFDFDAAESPSSTLPIDDFAGLTLGGPPSLTSSSSSNNNNNNQSLSLFDLNPADFMIPSTPIPSSSSYTPQPISTGTYFSNTTTTNASSTINWGGTSSPSTSNGNGNGNGQAAGGSRSATPGAIQLTTSTYTPSIPVKPTPPTTAATKDPFGDLLDLKF
jgi:hypothetical protein